MAERDNPWKKLSTREAYDNPWIRVDEDEIINPAGKPGIYGKIHFKSRACAIIPIDTNGHTWLVGQYRYVLDAYSWEIPMGGVPLGEDLLAGAQRELKEETGLTASHWEQILNVHISNSVSDETGVVFVATGLTEGEPEFEDTEDITIKRLPFADALQMTVNGEITDLLSVAGLLRYASLAGD